MSILKWLWKLKIEKFPEVVKNRGIKVVNVVVLPNSSGGVAEVDYSVRLWLKAGSFESRPKEFCEKGGGKIEVEKLALKEAAEIAEGLVNSGFRVTINGKTISEIKIIVKEYELLFREYSQIRNHWLPSFSK